MRVNFTLRILSMDLVVISTIPFYVWFGSEPLQWIFAQATVLFLDELGVI